MPKSVMHATRAGQPLQPVGRRRFLQVASVATASTALLISGCNKDDDTPSAATVDLGSGDVGVLNYAYALEQLEAAFYAQIIATPYTGISAEEQAYFTSIAKHEAIHRDFFKAAITAAAPGNIIGSLTPDFSSVTFTDRSSVLSTAKTFEDLGVAAYNGAGKLLKNTDYLLLAGKIVSVEARHAAVIRDLINNGDFAADDVVDASTGLDKAMSVDEVLMAAQAFIKEKITATNVGK
ncbi:ferritin-like domain-containing protein [Rhodocytophaga aerolata]|uniref:Ferritin-like domain-containing protein n=1 Tax=Rhodocytophaga aerolata TaxID=455078 RepID=A0ABT8RJW2_9BACT|nr:ferritin-like domain-containing protein [Rhodocytophaga aerolata]MDO1451107.1 ferritin-like domain-containing protein [Rhodocytophaga aerolata]